MNAGQAREPEFEHFQPWPAPLGGSKAGEPPVASHPAPGGQPQGLGQARHKSSRPLSGQGSRGPLPAEIGGLHASKRRCCSIGDLAAHAATGGHAAPALPLVAALPLPCTGVDPSAPPAASTGFAVPALQDRIARAGAAGIAGLDASMLSGQLLQGQHPPEADPYHLLPAKPCSRQQQPCQPGPYQHLHVAGAAHAGASTRAGLPPRHPHAAWGGAGSGCAAGAAPRQPLAELLVPLQPAPAGLAALLPPVQPQGMPPRAPSAPVAVPAGRPVAHPLGPPAAPPSGGSATSSAFASCDSQEEAWETHSFGGSLECSESIDDLEEGFASAGLASAGNSPFPFAYPSGLNPFANGPPTAAAAAPLHAAPTVAAAGSFLYAPSLDGLDPVAAAALAEATSRAAHEGRNHSAGTAGYLHVQPPGTLDGYGFSLQAGGMVAGHALDPGHLISRAAAAQAQQQRVWERERAARAEAAAAAASAALPPFDPAELREANAAIGAIAIPDLQAFVPVHETDCLIPLATRHGIPPISIALGASYFQRLLVRDPGMQDVARASGFFISTYPTAQAPSGQQPRPVVMMRSCNIGCPRSDYLLAVYCTCIYLAAKVADHVRYKQMLSSMLSLVVAQEVSPADAINLEGLVLKSLDWRLGPFFNYSGASGAR